jgi:hypothetical protein
VPDDTAPAADPVTAIGSANEPADRALSTAAALA